MELQDWIKKAKTYFKEYWGLSDYMCEKVSYMLIYFENYGVKYTITSGFRDPEKQKAMRKAWDTGDQEAIKRYGIIARPAVNSQHSVVDFLGNPSSDAIDIKVPPSQQAIADAIARFLGLGTGSDFKDPVHYYKKNAR